MTINEAKKVIEGHYSGFVATRGFLYKGRFYFNIVNEVTNKVPLIGGIPYVDKRTGKIGTLDPINPGEGFDRKEFREANSHPVIFE